MGLAKAKDTKLERRIEALERMAKDRGISNQVLERLIAQQNNPNGGSAGKIGGKENNYTAALNWYLNAHTRVMFNYVRAHVYGAPSVNRGHLNIFALRFQIDF